MPAKRNIFAALLSVALGILTIVIAYPKKAAKKRENSPSETAKREDNLFV